MTDSEVFSSNESKKSVFHLNFALGRNMSNGVNIHHGEDPKVL